MFRFFLLAFISLLLATPSLKAQNDLPKATLPQIEVRPPKEAVPSENSVSDAEETVPPKTVRPPEQSLPQTSVANRASTMQGSRFSFPNLTDLQFGQPSRPFGENSGILRSEKSLFDTSAAGSIRSRQEIAERQATDMLHALQNEVGVLMQSTAAGQASPFVRGLTGQQVLILVDGIRLNNSVTRRGPNQYFNTIDPGMVDRIEVLRGQGSVLWGSDAIGGAINVVTRGPDTHYGVKHGDYSSGEFTQYYNTSNSSPYSRLNVEGWMGNVGVFVGGSYADVNNLDTGWDQFPNGQGGRQPGTNFQQWAGDIKFKYLLDEGQMLTFSLQHFQQDNLPRSDRFPGYPGDLNNSNSLGGARFFDPQQRDLAYIRYQALDPLAGIDALTVTASYNRQRENQTRGIPTTRFQEIDVETLGLQAVAVKDLDWAGKWTSGFDWYYDDVDSPFGGTASGPIVPDDAWYQRIGAFCSWDVALTERLNMVTGIRYENINTAGTPVVEGTPTFINPNYHDWVSQIGLVYEIDPDIHLVGSISEGFRAPNLDDLMALNPNVLQEGSSVPSLGLRPERSINYELGIKTAFDRLRTQTFVFYTDLRDNIVSIDTAVPNTFGSANQDSFVQGVETSGEYLLDDGWSLYGNFWYTYGINRVTNSPLSRVPPTQGILGFRWRERHLRSYFEVYTWMVRRQDRLEQVRDITDERIPIGGTPGYATLNMRVGRSYGDYDQHRVSLSLENITDKNYLVHGSGVFGTGATARLGYRLTY